MWIRSAFSAIKGPSLAWWRSAVLVAVVAGGVALWVTQPHRSGPNLAPSNSPDPISQSEIRSVLWPDAIRAVDHPTFVASDRAGIRSDVSVMGIELGGEAHAYPIAVMSRIEIVNDRLGGSNIAVTW